jgi:YcaO-like protein with predicted kinase domain
MSAPLELPFAQFRAAPPFPKNYRYGTHRSVTPEDTLQRLQPLLPSLGITRVANVTGLDHIGVPVVMVCRPNSRSLATSQGKGLTLAAAKVSGLMESIELHHAEHIHQPLVLGCHRELCQSHTLVEVEHLPSIRNTRYGPHLQLLWIEGYDLLRDCRVWLPFEVVHASAKVPPPMGSGCFSATSNGLASGNHLLEAALHGLYEVIERDATALWEIASDADKAATRLNLTSVDDEPCRWVLEKCEAADVTVAVWNTTSDIQIPSFICEIDDPVRAAMGQPSTFIGMGAHTSRAIALLRALTEAVQCRLTLISGSRDDLFRREYGNQCRIERLATSHKRQSLYESGLNFAMVANIESETFNGDLAFVLDRLRTIGITSVIVVNLTRPEYGIPVVRVVVPGLEGPDDDPEYLPGPRARARRRP